MAHIGPILLPGEDGRSEACEVAFRNNCAQYQRNVKFGCNKITDARTYTFRAIDAGVMTTWDYS